MRPHARPMAQTHEALAIQGKAWVERWASTILAVAGLVALAVYVALIVTAP